MRLRELHFERKKPLPAMFKELTLDCGYRLDLLVWMFHSSWLRPVFSLR
ncbi:MAG: hypothetical protein ABSG91_04560 [Syntrophobacteraceae bacterium]